jgi:hypothetical protein
VEHCEEVLQSGQDISQFMASSDSTLTERRPFLLNHPEPKPSPILARRTAVMEEWSNLQRTRALSHSESADSELAPGTAAGETQVSTTPPSSLLSTAPPSSSDRNGTETVGGDGDVTTEHKEVSDKLLSSK